MQVYFFFEQIAELAKECEYDADGWEWLHEWPKMRDGILIDEAVVREHVPQATNLVTLTADTLIWKK